MPIAITATGVAQPERLGSYTPGRQVIGALRTAASATGVSFDVLAAKAAMESSFRPDAQASTSSARGLFQFIDQTWLRMVQQHGAEHGLGAEAAAVVAGPGGRLTVLDPAERSRILALRDNPELSARFAGEYLKNVSESLTPVLGRRPDAAELYLGHFLGAGGAIKILQAQASDPGQAASAVLPAAAAANPGMFNGPDGKPLSVAQFTSRIRGRLERVSGQLGLTTPAGPIEIQPSAVPATATRAVAGEPGGWGSGSPARMANGAERVLVSTLTRVFSRMSRAAAGHEAGDDNERGLPVEILTTLRSDTQTAATGRL